MRIVHQSAPDSHSPFFAVNLVRPFLALPAPCIAGLLPATIAFSPCHARAIYLRSACAGRSERSAARSAVRGGDMLLEIAVEFMIGTFPEAALRAAEVVFHRAAGGTSAIRPLGPAAFNAEIDADWLESMAAAKRARPLSDNEAEAMVSRAHTTRKAGAA